MSATSSPEERQRALNTALNVFSWMRSNLKANERLCNSNGLDAMPWGPYPNCPLPTWPCTSKASVTKRQRGKERHDMACAPVAAGDAGATSESAAIVTLHGNRVSRMKSACIGLQSPTAAIIHAGFAANAAKRQGRWQTTATKLACTKPPGEVKGRIRNSCYNDSNLMMSDVYFRTDGGEWRRRFGRQRRVFGSHD